MGGTRRSLLLFHRASHGKDQAWKRSFFLRRLGILVGMTWFGLSVVGSAQQDSLGKQKRDFSDEKGVLALSA